jgi:hypothetical protein
LHVTPGSPIDVWRKLPRKVLQVTDGVCPLGVRSLYDKLDSTFSSL